VDDNDSNLNGTWVYISYTTRMYDGMILKCGITYLKIEIINN
jgi:hypothetical protein